MIRPSYSSSSIWNWNNARESLRSMLYFSRCIQCISRYQNHLWSRFTSNVNPKIISCVCFVSMLPLVQDQCHFSFHKSGHLLLMSKMKMNFRKKGKKGQSAVKLKPYRRHIQIQRVLWFLYTEGKLSFLAIYVGAIVIVIM